MGERLEKLFLSGRIKPRLVTVTQAAAPAMNTDSGDIFTITGLAQAITSMTTNLTGAPTDGEKIEIRITDNATARAIAWGAKFVASTVALPTTTVLSVRLRTCFEYDTVASAWVLLWKA
jgi:L-cysteine desulfidase